MAKCVGCKCTDDFACEGGCHWIVVDYSIDKGVCSSCIDKVQGFYNRYGRIWRFRAESAGLGPKPRRRQSQKRSARA